MWTIINAIHESSVECYLIKQGLLGSFNADEGGIMVWTGGPPGYNPSTHDGDYHSTPDVVHVSDQVMPDNNATHITMIHEGAHKQGWNDEDAYFFENECAGNAG